jgi:serine phosphatase RsbU (regulator of sigma subunit)
METPSSNPETKAPASSAPAKLLAPMDVAMRTGWSIRVKLALSVSALVALSLALLSTFILLKTRDALIRETTNRGIIIGRGLADYSSSAVLSNDPLNAARFAKDALSNEGMVYAVLTDNNNMVLAAQMASHNKGTLAPGQSFQEPQGEELEVEGLPNNAKVVLARYEETGETILAFSFPIEKANVRLGTAYIALSQSKIQAVVDSVTEDVLLLGVAFIVLAIAASMLMTGPLVKPVQRLTRGALAIGSGDLDTQIKAESNDELGVLARSFNAMTRSLKQAQEELVEKQLLKQELNIAQEIQQGLLPKKVPQLPGYEIAAFYAPAKEVGGDYYDFIRISNTKLAFTVADVSGKSVPGSLGMTMARSVLRSQALSNSLPGETLRKTNEVIQPDIRRGMFVTMFYSILDTATHTVQSGNAGHNPAYKVKADNSVEEIAPEGIALGLVSAQQFYIEEHTMSLAPGDLLVLYTDGVTEAMNAASEEYGEDRFVASLKKRSQESSLQRTCDLVMEDLKAFVAGAPPHDDITLLLVRRLS